MWRGTLTHESKQGEQGCCRTRRDGAHKSRTCFSYSPIRKKKSGTCMPHSPNYPRCNRCCVKICNKNKGQRERCNGFSSTLTGTHQSFTLACKTCCEGSRNEVFTRLYIRIFSSEKAFTRSQSGRFLLIFKCFKCEGLGFQAFTPPLADEPAVNA